MAPGGGRASMRAVQYSSFGGGSTALKHVQVPVPSPKKDEVLIKVQAVSINPADWNLQKGLLRPFVPRLPFIPVSDVAGEVVEIGSSVCEFKVGDYVVSKIFFMKAGGLAEYVAVSERETVACPAGLPAADVAGLPMAGLTALQALKSIGTKFDGGAGTGANVLITAASGGIGTYAVQLAKLGNHHVTATCGARNLDLVRGLGADEVLDYTTPAGAALRSPSGRKYDYVINLTTDGRWAVFKQTLSRHGRVVDVAPCCENYVASVMTLFSSRQKIRTMLMTFVKEELRFLVGLVKEGKLRTVVDSTHPLEKAGDAWERSLSGHATGKVIVEM